MDVTPKVAQLCVNLSILMANLETQMKRLAEHLGAEDILILRPALENIVDREMQKILFKKQWKVKLLDTISTLEDKEYSIISDY